jgi:hypothetical protein
LITADDDRRVGADPVPGGLDHDHRAVLEIADRLIGLAARLDQSHLDLVADAHGQAERRREVVQPRNGNTDRLGHLREVVGRHERGAALTGHADEQGVDVAPAVILDQMDLNGRGALQLDHRVETATKIFSGAPEALGFMPIRPNSSSCSSDRSETRRTRA